MKKNRFKSALLRAAIWLLPISIPLSAASNSAADERETEGQGLAAELRRPQQPLSANGLLVTHGGSGSRVYVPVSMQVQIDGSKWRSIYQASLPGQPNFERLTIIHQDDRPSQYLDQLISTNGSITHTATLTGNQADVPFAGSNFWLADLGLEFLHWPQQRLYKKTMRQGRACRILESVNPHPDARSYSRVLSWIDNETGGLFRAEAYSADAKRLKTFELSHFEKINGHWEVKEMEIRTMAPQYSVTKLQLDLKVK